MKQLPNTDSISELEAFWQQNDMPDFGAELEEVPEPIFQRTGQFILKLSSRDAVALRSRARAVPVSESELVSQWVHEKLDTSSS